MCTMTMILMVLIFSCCGGLMVGALSGAASIVMLLWYMIVVGIPMTIALICAVISAPFIGVAALIFLIIGIFTSLASLFSFILAVLSGGKARFTFKAFKGVLVLAAAFALVWYYLPANPVKEMKDEVSYIKVSSPDVDAEMYIRSGEAVEDFLETLKGYSLHRTVKKFTPAEVQNKGMFMTLYNRQGEILKTYNVCEAEYFGEAEGRVTHFYKSYSVLGKKINLNDLHSAVKIDGDLRNGEFNDSMKELYRTAAVEGQAMTFTIPADWDSQYMSWNIKPVRVTYEDREAVLFEEESKEYTWKAGKTYTIPLEEPVDKMEFSFVFDGYVLTQEVQGLLPKEYLAD